MMRWKVCVYAIAKNEIKFVDQWFDSMKEADWIVVLDTGSTDGTVERLRELGCRVEVKPIEPWRFDVARNESLKLVPNEADICICTDFDELLHKGWRDVVEKHWTSDAVQGRYRYTWSFNPDGTEGTVFLYDKIHVNHDFEWTYPVHEILHYKGTKKHVFVALPGMQLDHHPDPVKSRGSYLPLLEMAATENPENDRNIHYLGREYMFYRRWQECIDTLKKHLELPSATWKEERCASMRYIGRCYENMGQTNGAMEYYWKAIAEAPYLREPYTEMAKMLYRQEDWYGVLFLVDKILKIRTRTATYICEADAWGSLPYDIASMAFFHVGNIPMALNMARGAHDRAPSDERINKNLELFDMLIKKQDEINERIAIAGIAQITIPEKRNSVSYDLAGGMAANDLLNQSPDNALMNMAAQLAPNTDEPNMSARARFMPLNAAEATVFN